MREQLEQYVKRVKEWQEDCRGNEQATKASLIAPLFVILGYDMADPRECKPEYRMDFGKGEKAATPVDWAFLLNGNFAFFVEAKEVGAKLTKYPEQLGMYFGKQPGKNGVKLGILTNGTQWQFFTDLRNENAMDTEPFFTWDVLNDNPALAEELLTLLQKSEFTAQRIRTFAENRRHHSLLVVVVNQLLEPSNDFVRLVLNTPINEAGDTLASSKITEKVVENWKEPLKEAIQEWAKQHDLKVALKQPHLELEAGTSPDGNSHAEKSERHELRKKFWAALLSRPKNKDTRHADLKPGEYSWISAGSGVRGLHFVYAVKQRAGRVELWIDRGPGQADQNKRIFDWLEKQMDEIERAFGSKLLWERLPEKRGCRVGSITASGGYRSQESKWPEIQDSMIDTMARLEKALSAYLSASVEESQ